MSLPPERPKTPPRPIPRVYGRLLGVAGCLLMAWFGTAAGGQFVKARFMRAENARIERRILELRLENQRLRKAVAALNTPQGMEREARRLGYVRPGEIPLVIPR